MKQRVVFPSLIGNSAIKDTLSPELAADKSAHAYILEGPAGSGKHTAAGLICASVLCQHRADKEKPLPCGQCDACRKVLGGLSVDVLTVSNGDKATIGVDAIRAVRESLYVTPNDGDKKFYIIEKAHLMTTAAQNALLLSLEEPPPYVFFILLCENATDLLETIRSRAPVIKMERFSPDFVEKWLTEQVGPAPVRDKILYASHLSGGALGRALELYENGQEAEKLYRTAGELVRLLLEGKKSEALTFVTRSMPKERQNTRQVLSLARNALRDILAEKKGGPLLFYSTADGTPAFAKNISARKIMELYRMLAEAEEDVGANVSQSTVLTSLIMNG